MVERIKEIKDKNGNCIYWKDDTGYETWAEYDENNNQIYWKNNTGFKN